MRKILKILLSILFLVVASEISVSQNRFGFNVIKSHPFFVRQIQKPSNLFVNDFFQVIDSLLIKDQLRLKLDPEIVSGIDSMNAAAYVRLIRKKGYLTSDINQYWNAIYGDETVPKSNSPEYAEKSMLLMSNYFKKRFALHLHFCDRFGVYLIQTIEQSVANDSVCSEEDLMDFVITYLFRKTEFKIDQFLGNYYSVILVPNLLHGSYAHYYNYAVNQYMRYAFRENPDVFRYIVFDNLFISNNNELNWSKISTSPVYENFKVINYLRNGELNVKFLDRYIIYWNAGIRKNCSYSIIFCRHDGVQQPRCGD